MQMHERPQGAPVLALALALARDSVSVKRMQNHAPYGCMTYYVKNSRISGIFDSLLRAHFGTWTGVNHALCREEFFTVIIVRSSVGPEYDGH